MVRQRKRIATSATTTESRAMRQAESQIDVASNSFATPRLPCLPLSFILGSRRQSNGMCETRDFLTAVTGSVSLGRQTHTLNDHAFHLARASLCLELAESGRAASERLLNTPAVRLMKLRICRSAGEG